MFSSSRRQIWVLEIWNLQTIAWGPLFTLFFCSNFAASDRKRWFLFAGNSSVVEPPKLTWTGRRPGGGGGGGGGGGAGSRTYGEGYVAAFHTLLCLCCVITKLLEWCGLGIENQFSSQNLGLSGVSLSLSHSSPSLSPVLLLHLVLLHVHPVSCWALLMRFHRAHIEEGRCDEAVSTDVKLKSLVL